MRNLVYARCKLERHIQVSAIYLRTLNIDVNHGRILDISSFQSLDVETSFISFLRGAIFISSAYNLMVNK